MSTFHDFSPLEIVFHGEQKPLPLTFLAQPLAELRSTLDLATLSNIQNTFCLGQLKVAPNSAPHYSVNLPTQQLQQHQHLEQ